MKTFLMHKDQDFDLQQKPPPNKEALIQDLGLNILFSAMAREDQYLFQVANKAVLSSLVDLHTILYRQDILKDCLKHPAVARDIYGVAAEAIENKKKYWWGFLARSSPGSILYSSRDLLQMLVGQLKKLKNIAHEHADKFASEGFTRFFAMLYRELDDEYFACIQNHLRELKFRDGVLISAELGTGNKSANHILRKPRDRKPGWMKRILAGRSRDFSYCISDRDEQGARALGELRDLGINLVANALAQATDQVLSFFNLLRAELAFYVGCLNLSEQLAQRGEPICFPVPVAAGDRRHTFRGLYDVCLALGLGLEQKVVGNDVDADGKELAIITGANQGGKSTFLRSLGSAQLMMQCGMFTPAESFCGNLCEGLFTHYQREEDVTMKSGKLAEELSRLSDIVDNLRKNSLVLFNESFAATNEREGSEIAGQIISALLEKRIKIFYVTHLYEFAHRFYGNQTGKSIFLRAERRADGRRSFKITEGVPLETSYGEDLYHRIFETGRLEKPADGVHGGEKRISPAA